MNIFEISRELENVYNEIEENGGELTSELEEQLSISEINFKDKVRDYTHVIQQLQFDLKNIKEEQDRLINLKKTKEKVIEKLSNILLDTLNKFGNVDKRGVKSIDYGTGKISTRKSSSVTINDGCVELISNKYFYIMQFLKETNQLDIDNSISKIEFLNQLNTEKNDTVITEDQLNELNVNIALTVPLNTLFYDKGYNMISNLLKYTSNFQTKPSVDKKRMKELIAAGGNYSAIAKVEEKINLAIK